jgi:hypothetical protein
VDTPLLLLISPFTIDAGSFNISFQNSAKSFVCLTDYDQNKFFLDINFNIAPHDSARVGYTYAGVISTAFPDRSYILKSDGVTDVARLQGEEYLQKSLVQATFEFLFSNGDRDTVVWRGNFHVSIADGIKQINLRQLAISSRELFEPCGPVFLDLRGRLLGSQSPTLSSSIRSVVPTGIYFITAKSTSGVTHIARRINIR